MAFPLVMPILSSQNIMKGREDQGKAPQLPCHNCVVKQLFWKSALRSLRCIGGSGFSSTTQSSPAMARETCRSPSEIKHASHLFSKATVSPAPMKPPTPEESSMKPYCFPRSLSE